MAFVDVKGNSVVIRIVYDGPPYAGKTTSVRSLARSLMRNVETPGERDGRTLFFDWLEYTGGLFEGRQIRCQIVSVPGQAELAERRRALLETADVVVFVADTGDQEAVDRSAASIREMVEMLDQDPPVGVIVQANKRDLPTAVPRDQVRLALGDNFARTALTESVADSGNGVRETFVLAVRVALDRIRAQIGDDSELSKLVTVDVLDNAEQLLAALEKLPILPATVPLPVLKGEEGPEAKADGKAEGGQRAAPSEGASASEGPPASEGPRAIEASRASESLPASERTPASESPPASEAPRAREEVSGVHRLSPVRGEWRDPRTRSSPANLVVRIPDIKPAAEPAAAEPAAAEPAATASAAAEPAATASAAAEPADGERRTSRSGVWQVPPERRTVRVSPSQVEGAGEPEQPPRLPDTKVPTGAIWPPVEGRLVLHEAEMSGLVAHRAGGGDWAAGVGGSWRVHSALAARFHDFDEGRRALVEWARVHAGLVELISGSRCVVLADAGNGSWRLWQVVRVMPTLRTWLADAAGFELPQLYRRLVTAAAVLGEAHGRLSETRLPITLDTIGRGEGGSQYVALMPQMNATQRVPRPTVENVEASVAEQLGQLLGSELLERRSELSRSVVSMWRGVLPWDAVVTAAIAGKRQP